MNNLITIHTAVTFNPAHLLSAPAICEATYTETLLAHNTPQVKGLTAKYQVIRLAVRISDVYPRRPQRPGRRALWPTMQVHKHTMVTAFYYT